MFYLLSFLRGTDVASICNDNARAKRHWDAAFSISPWARSLGLGSLEKEKGLRMGTKKKMGMSYKMGLEMELGSPGSSEAVVQRLPWGNKKNEIRLWCYGTVRAWAAVDSQLACLN